MLILEPVTGERPLSREASPAVASPAARARRRSQCDSEIGSSAPQRLPCGKAFTTANRRRAGAMFAAMGEHARAGEHRGTTGRREDGTTSMTVLHSVFPPCSPLQHFWTETRSGCIPRGTLRPCSVIRDGEPGDAGGGALRGPVAASPCGSRAVGDARCVDAQLSSPSAHRRRPTGPGRHGLDHALRPHAPSGRTSPQAVRARVTGTRHDARHGHGEGPASSMRGLCRVRPHGRGRCVLSGRAGPGRTPAPTAGRRRSRR